MEKVKDLFEKFDYIKVPDYQRAYSWDDTQIEQFLLDIKEYIDKKGINYYIGHFLFEKNKDNEKIGYIIDGQQRLTTIIIFLSSAFEKIKKLNNGELAPEELNIYKSIIEENGKIKFSTVDYDNKLFKERVIGREKGVIKPETQSQNRILDAVKYFNKKLEKETIENLTNMVKIIINASCTLNEVLNQSEAIQMFIYQNDRGKHPTDLEIIKSLFMYNIYDCSDNKINDLNYIKEKFETIYKNISYIENLVNENDVLRITLKTYYKNLNESSIDRIKEDINNNIAKDKLNFIKSFTEELEKNFQYLKYFFEDEKKYLYIHSIITLGINIDLYPFIVGIYRFGINEDDKKKLIESLENLLIRMKIIGSRAYITYRIGDTYEEFVKTYEDGNVDITSIINRISNMKTSTNYWWGHWNNDKLIASVENGVNGNIAKFILWKYENSFGDRSFEFRYDKEKINLEHIALRIEPDTKPHGYGDYNDEEFINLIYCLGNLILLSEKHNKSIGNTTFYEKYKTYTYLKQQEEIRNMVSENGTWGKSMIKKRKKKIVDFVMSYYK
ncbi:DUF262 domain-containing protein [Brachyspira aalborgi]|uniref:DUF262 domain-containing protein n=1 Tax=Brachyspira aalborgi TaxID=29522 RepID=A0A5C8G3A5_9SPIR|nr:DUF262 domain-containing protein [Brachyspira aalborgi]TXJ56366.1 DUF262 domain-containing protein [Brachyspira aalborgi]